MSDKQYLVKIKRKRTRKYFDCLIIIVNSVFNVVKFVIKHFLLLLSLFAQNGCPFEMVPNITMKTQLLKQEIMSIT